MTYAPSPLANELKDLEQQGHYVELISVLKAHMTHNKRTFADPYVKEWVGKRWRNLFIQEAVQDKHAVKVVQHIDDPYFVYSDINQTCADLQMPILIYVPSISH